MVQGTFEKFTASHIVKKFSSVSEQGCSLPCSQKPILDPSTSSTNYLQTRTTSI
jgi:hypothetical protein